MLLFFTILFFVEFTCIVTQECFYLRVYAYFAALVAFILTMN